MKGPTQREPKEQSKSSSWHQANTARQITVLKKMLSERSKMARTVAEKFALLNPKEVAKEQATHKSVSWSAREKRVRAGARWEGVKLVLLSQIRIKRATKRATRWRSIHEIERNASLRNEIKVLG